MQNVVQAMRSVVIVFVLLAAGSPLVAEAAPKASIVMDMRNGEVLYARSADRKLHPASLTKMMTLYLTFEAIRAGRLRLDQRVRVSRHAARQPASKLYLRAGQRVTIRSLIRATAIKSANDAAMVLAEAVAGSQSNFAEQMTRKARSLGMNNSRFRNPHGLTQKGHYSTVRDMAILSRHLFFDFPKYWNVFGRRSAYAAGKRIWNTNRLLRSYAGADGLKTGYTRAAGYNLAASAKRGRKHVLAIQFGANSSADRSRRVTRLLDMGFSRAKSRVRSVKPQGQRRDPVVVSTAPIPRSKPGSPATGLAAVSAALAPSQAQAATNPSGELAAVPQSETIMSSSRLAPSEAEVPRARSTSRRFKSAPVQTVTPIPRERPVHMASQGQLSWAAEIGPFESESDSLVQLAQLPQTAVARVSKSPSGEASGAYKIVMPLANEAAGAEVCGAGFSAPAECRVVNGLAGR